MNKKIAKTYTNKLNRQLQALPQKPGSYLFRDKEGEVLYVGKANNLRSRVKSYFRKKADLTPAKKAMVKKITELETVVVQSELEALILEETLIKKYRPRYNILLKDDKHYLFIKITTGEDFPRILTVRRINKDRARYFGPFTSSRAVRDTLGLLQKIFPYRTCNLDLAFNAKSTRQYRPCLRYHMNRCPAPCASRVSKQDYRQTIDTIALFLEGKLSFVLKDLEEQMNKAAARQDFEKAAHLRDQVAQIKHLTKKQVVLSPKFTNQDVVGFVTNRGHTRAYATILKIREGRLLAQENLELKILPDNTDQEIVRALTLNYYRQATFLPRDLVLPLKLKDAATVQALFKQKIKRARLKTTFRITQGTRGVKKGLLNLAEENALEYRAKKNLQADDRATAASTLRKLARALGMSKTPTRVEVYDISNTQGRSPVGSMVVFTKGSADKSQYRRFKINNLDESPNDVGMLREVLSRRLKKELADEAKWPSPDLIILDGGKPQLNAGLAVLEELDLDIPMAALAKKEELFFVPHLNKPVRLPADSAEMFLAQRMRDEAHRFAITFHRKLRGKRARRSMLDEIPGIGPARKKLLLQKYGSLDAISQAPPEELKRLIGQKAAHSLAEQLA